MVKAVTPITPVRARFFDRCGKPLSGGKVYTYAAHSTTPKATYTDAYGLTENTNPVVLDMAGEADIYLNGTYRIRVTDLYGSIVNDNANVGTWVSAGTQASLDDLGGALDEKITPMIEAISKQATGQLSDLQSAIDAAAAAGAGENGWTDALVRAADGRTQKEINSVTIQTVETIADLIAIQSPHDKQVIQVKSYYPPIFGEANPYRGGGRFIYVAENRGINNNVTVINGWVRDLSSKILTTDDAGLKGNGTDKTADLQNFLTCAQISGFTIVLSGQYKITTQLRFGGVNDVKITGNNFKIEGVRDKFIFNGHQKGLIQFHDCNNIEVSNLKVKGVRLDNLNDPVGEERYQNGDTGIELLNCNVFDVNNNSVDYVKAWGILCQGCQDGSITYNTIIGTARQSGINAIVGSRYGKVVIAYNTCAGCGLYGIEMEGRPNDITTISTAIVHNNTLIGCGVAISCVGPQGGTVVHDNSVIDCATGIHAVDVNINNNTLGRLKIYANNVSGCEIGIGYSNATRTDIFGNTCDATLIPGYGVKSPYATVNKITGDKSFNTGRYLSTGQTIYINNVAYVVQSVSSFIDTDVSNQTAYAITVDKSLTSVTTGDMIAETFTRQAGLTAFYKDNPDCNVDNNSVIGYDVGFTNTAKTSGSFTDNKLTNCNKPFYMAADAGNMLMRGNRHSGSASAGGVVSYFAESNGKVIKKPINVVNAMPSDGSNSQIITFTLENDCYVNEIRLQLFDGFITQSGSVAVVKIDSGNSATRAISDLTTKKMLNEIVALGAPFTRLAAGTHTLQLVDTLGQLQYKAWQITLLTF